MRERGLDVCAGFGGCRATDGGALELSISCIYLWVGDGALVVVRTWKLKAYCNRRSIECGERRRRM